MVATRKYLDYRPRGNGRVLFRWLEGTTPPPRQALVEGPANTGKSRIVGEFLYEAGCRWAHTRILVVRKYRADIHLGWQRTFEEDVLPPGSTLLSSGGTGDGRQVYHWPNQATLRFGCMDDAQRLYGSEWDIIFWNEAVEAKRSEWMRFFRALRKGKRPTQCPFRLLIGDCNPDAPDHWLNRACRDGKILRIVTRHADNPTFSAEDQQRLDDLEGVWRSRLRDGLWVSAEGVVLDTYDSSVHLIEAEIENHEERGILLHKKGQDEPIPLLWFVGGQDIGHSVPGAAEVFGFDKDDIGYRVAEVYQTRRDHQWWADVWAEMYETFPVRRILCDHDKAFIESLNRRLRRHDRSERPIARPANKHRKRGDEMVGIDELRVRFRQNRLYLVKDALWTARDASLAETGQPSCLEEEIPQVVYRMSETNVDRCDDPDPSCHNHAFDASRYVFRWVKDRSLRREKEQLPCPRGSLDDRLGLNEFWLRQGWRPR